MNNKKQVFDKYNQMMNQLVQYSEYLTDKPLDLLNRFINKMSELELSDNSLNATQKMALDVFAQMNDAKVDKDNAIARRSGKLLSLNKRKQNNALGFINILSLSTLAFFVGLTVGCLIIIMLLK